MRYDGDGPSLLAVELDQQVQHVDLMLYVKICGGLAERADRASAWPETVRGGAHEDGRALKPTSGTPACRAAGADQRRHRAGGRLQVDPVQHAVAPVVAEADALEADRVAITFGGSGAGSAGSCSSSRP
ncbi:hypothetical protein GCM10022419_120380 [Nonomuraea rosea]|uniref:Uncharacterized protein n=1 Tax=Nonomuraea rosea TaxID=638574 RepID=A0ABP6ZQF5_9ACTN